MIIRRRLSFFMVLLMFVPAIAIAHDMAGMDMHEDSAPVTAAGTPIGGGFTLIDQNGKRVSDKDFAGKYQLIYFGFTNCPDTCPVDLKKMTDALKMLGPSGDKIAPIFITVDPERDTPAALKTYVTQFSPRLIGLTGKPEQIKRVESGYKVYAAKSDAAKGEDYTVNHSAYLYLMGPDGKFIDVMDGADKAPDIAAKLKKLTS